METYLLRDFGLVFERHVDHSLSTCRRGGGHQMSQEGGAGEYYGMKAVCMLEDVLMFAVLVSALRLFWELSETH